MRHALTLQVGPASFRIGSDWRTPVEQLAALYADYPAPRGAADFTVRLSAARPWRRWLRPAVMLGGDHMLPGAAPLPLAHGLLAAEMGMNLQMALGWRRHLLLHAAAVERDGRALLITGESGAGKSTLSLLLAARGWRFLGDEFALVDPVAGALHPFPRPVSVKNGAITLARAAMPAARFGPTMAGTPKGDIVHVALPSAALDPSASAEPPALILFPQHGHAPAQRSVRPSECFVRLTQASTNYVTLGEAGFRALTRLVTQTPAVAIDYPDSATAIEQVERLWEAL